jgi:hypothetical protein
MPIGGNIMKINELLEKAGIGASCGCTADSCSHCAGKHTLEEVGQKCSCCGNEIKEVKMNEDVAASTTSASDIGTIASVPGAKRKISSTGRYGAPKAPQKTNADGTAKNALDVKDNIMGGKAIKR